MLRAYRFGLKSLDENEARYFDCWQGEKTAYIRVKKLICLTFLSSTTVCRLTAHKQRFRREVQRLTCIQPLDLYSH